VEESALNWRLSEEVVTANIYTIQLGFSITLVNVYPVSPKRDWKESGGSCRHGLLQR
jgi:hypothetical protein